MDSLLKQEKYLNRKSLLRLFEQLQWLDESRLDLAVSIYRLSCSIHQLASEASVSKLVRLICSS